MIERRKDHVTRKRVTEMSPDESRFCTILSLARTENPSIALGEARATRRCAPVSLSGCHYGH
jgi:hypothetical protein